MKMSLEYHREAHRKWKNKPGNREKGREATRRWLAKEGNRDLVLANRWRRNGMPMPDRPRPTLCDCCGKHAKIFCLDHNHRTGHFRGWLCSACNRGIGLLGDSVEGLQRAVYYLRVIANDDLFG